MPTIDNKSDITKPLNTPESSLDTGTGGFNIDDKVQTFDVGIVTEKQSTVTYSPGNVTTNAGFIGHDSKPLDISVGTKNTLAHYLSNLTHGNVGIGSKPDTFKRRPNAYPIGEASDTTAYKSISITGPNGETPSFGTYSSDGNFSSNSSGGGFAPGNTGPAMRTLSPDALKLDKFARGGSKSVVIGDGEANGHGLLRSATTQENFDKAFAVDVTGKFPTTLDETMPAGAYTTALLNNRFTSQQPMSGTPEAHYENSVINTEGMNHKQFVHGYTKGVSAIPDTARKFSMGQLAQIGTILGIRASGEPNSDNPMSTAGMNVEETTAILPGSAQSGLAKIRLGLLEAKDVLNHLTDDSAIQGSQLVSIAPDLGDSVEGASWGSLNSALDQYSGASNFGMMLLSAAMIIATTVVIAGFSEIVAFIKKLSNPNPTFLGEGGKLKALTFDRQDSQQRRYVGSSSRRSAPGGIDIKSLLNIARTNNDYFLCARTGVFAFFGLGDFTNGSQIGAALLSALVNSVKTPEHTVIQARAFLRSFLVIADSMKSVVTAFKSNPLAGSKQILNFTNVLMHSRFLGAFNTFAILGDAVLSFSEDADKVDKVASDGGFGRKISRMDAVPEGNAHSRNRLGKTLTLAWSSFTSPDLIAVSDGSYKNSKKLSSRTVLKQLSDLESHRIDLLTREKFETALDAEYLPFYFHDLRTNEIVSFHAFLATLGESYTATYDSVEGFGRVDPVKIYKNTHRKIDLSFYIAATSSDDFDTMWYKINKLTTLMYPQYTEGKKINAIDPSKSNNQYTTNYNFFAPFSQQIAASPMIRLRIGDLIRSNYSKYNLARMFGYENPNAQFGKHVGREVIFDIKNPAHKKIMMNEYYKQGNKFKFSNDATNSLQSDKDLLIAVGLEFTLEDAYEPMDPAEIVFYANGMPISNDESQKMKFKVGVVTAPNEGEKKGIPNAQKFIDDVISGKKKFGPNKLFFLENGSVYCNLNQAAVTPTVEQNIQIEKSVLEEISLQNSHAAGNAFAPKGEELDIVTGIEDFMASDNNAIVKSFESVGGKGLPGFIDSMNFDWHEKVTWAGIGDPNNTNNSAPKLCKVTISFTPIHDISPGIDAFGKNRAPIYPVGNSDTTKNSFNPFYMGEVDS